MKALLLPLLLTTSVFAANLEVTEYDQAKLAHFLNKLPSGVVIRKEDVLTGGKRVVVVFPRKSEVLRVECVSEFMEPSPVPSLSSCKVEIDINHQSLEKNYDEIRLKDVSEDTAKALFAVMPHGKDTKSFRSGEFEEGTDFNGRRTNIFSYLFECTQTSCLYRFSEKMIK